MKKEAKAKSFVKKACKLWFIFAVTVLLGGVVEVVFPYYAVDCEQLRGDCTGGYCSGNKICVNKGYFCECEYTPPPWPEQR